MTGTGPATVPELAARVRRGEHRAVARLLSLVEDGSPRLPEVAAALLPGLGGPGPRVVGVTGAPGVGKSTVVAALVAAYRRSGTRVGVIAVDPSSPFSTGALLGDRIRMQGHATDPGVFIRSMATRGHLGGMAAATPAAVRVLAAAGSDVVVVETVGVGQSEVDVASLADTTVVMLAPGLGDGVQLAKAGILEIGDVYVVNKADRDGSRALVRELRRVIRLADRPAEGWDPPVVATVASEGEGITELVEALAAHHDHLVDRGELAGRRAARARAEIEAIALGAVRDRLGRLPGGAALDDLAARVASGRCDPYRAADELLAELDGGSLSGSGQHRADRPGRAAGPVRQG